MTSSRIIPRLLAAALLATLPLSAGCADPATMGAMAAANAAQRIITDIANSPKTAAETAVSATGNGKTTIIRGRTSTVIVRDGKTTIIKRPPPTQ